MRAKSQTITQDGFERNVAEKMPKIKKLEEPLPSDFEEATPSLQEDQHETIQEVKSPEKIVEREDSLPSLKKAVEREQDLDVLRLIEDLHNQLLLSSRTKKALEIDLVSYKKTIHQLTQDNKDLRSELEDLRKQLQRLKEIQSESIYLKEENIDALEKIQEFQQELRELKEILAKTANERNEALGRVHELESQMEENELIRIKGRMKEREASHFYEENRTLQSNLEEALTKNMELERKYETLRRSFNEVKESLTLLRDSCKKSYYDYSGTSE